MAGRRQFIKQALAAIASLLLPWGTGIRKALAGAAKTLLPKDTPLKSLIQKNPSELDTRNLPIEPLADFETMGLTDHRVDPAEWRLEISGLGEENITFRYEEILAMPSLEREVLLICPGFFANHGRWTGISLGALLKKAGIPLNAARVAVKGPEGPFHKTAGFPLEDVLSDRVFLAHHVNGVPLPQKHGYPLRVVAEGYYGFDWIKYATFVRVEKGSEKTDEG